MQPSDPKNSCHWLENCDKGRSSEREGNKTPAALSCVKQMQPGHLFNALAVMSSHHIMPRQPRSPASPVRQYLISMHRCYPRLSDAKHSDSCPELISVIPALEVCKPVRLCSREGRHATQRQKAPSHNFILLGPAAPHNMMLTYTMSR